MDEPEITLKILLVGDSSVIKTTLLLKYVEGKFLHSHITSIGVEYKDKEIIIDKKKLISKFRILADKKDIFNN